ncbi:MAG: hypothetical protein ACE5D1_00080 [Fidelibacterota bacterium]
MGRKLLDTIKKLWSSFLEFQDYRWKRGSSCCMPSYSDLEHNPFRFDKDQHCH